MQLSNGDPVPGRSPGQKHSLPSLSKWEAITELVRRNLCDEESLKPLPFDPGHVIFAQLSSSTGEKKWKAFKRFVSELISREGEIPPALARRIGEAQNHEGRSIFQHLLKVKGGAIGARILLDAGVVPSECHYRAHFDRGLPPTHLSFGSLMHQAALEGKAGTIATLIQRGYPVDEPDRHNRTPLQLCGAALLFWLSTASGEITPAEQNEARKILNAAKELLAAGADPLRGNPGESFVHSYLSYLPSSNENTLGELLKSKLAGHDLRLTEVRSVPMPMAIGSLMDEVRSLRSKNLPDPDLATTETLVIREAIRSGISLRALVSVVKTLSKIRGVAANPQLTSASLVPALPELLFSLPSVVPGRVVSSIDRFLHQRGRNPWEPELFALFCRKDIWTKDGIGPKLVEAITAPFDFIKNGVLQLKPRTCKDFSIVGEFTWSHTKWKADTKSPGFNSEGRRIPPLMVQFGFRRLNNHKKVGPGYRLQFPGGWIELWRGCILASFEKSGSILIANSSPLFGRKLFTTPAYFNPHYLPLPNGREDRCRGMIDAFYSKDTGFVRLLTPRLYQDQKLRRKISRSLLSLREKLTEYSDWKCTTRREDTWITKKSETLMKFGAGYTSPGLRCILESAKAYNRTVPSGTPPLALAWVPPKMPPMTFYSFKNQQGELVRELELTDSVIQAIEARINDTGTREMAFSSGEHQFFACGFSNQAELLVLDRRRRSTS